MKTKSTSHASQRERLHRDLKGKFTRVSLTEERGVNLDDEERPEGGVVGDYNR